MRNWAESEETGNQNCSVEEDHRDAKRVCDHLGLPLHEADFVDQYWNRVFSHFVAQYSKGLTPNPDLECNRCIKFDALLKHAQGLGAGQVATGHYARLKHDVDGEWCPSLLDYSRQGRRSCVMMHEASSATPSFALPTIVTWC